MRNFALVILIFIVLGAGCADADVVVENLSDDEALTESVIEGGVDLVLPVDGYAERLRVKAFGEFIQDRFSGFHVGDDIEFTDVEGEVLVYAIADGVVKRAEFVSGYGGLVIVEHVVGEQVYTALYGHLDPADLPPVERVVEMGQILGRLGEGESIETDWERKHLHFGLYLGAGSRLQGYEATEAGLGQWVNPSSFFIDRGALYRDESRVFSDELGSEVFAIDFEVPVGLEVEYIPSIQSLNLFSLNGEGSARDRSQVLIRYFDAADFLTLSTVQIYSTEEDVVGDGYEARRYNIEKRDGIADFTDQPSWRNERHIVTDFRKQDGFGRYYVVAKNPELSEEVYQQLLDSIR